ncbi:MAG: transcriptional repressor [Campylobacterales bacterium]|nr:transcriptional repressor [Campylobacterales bacterium]
MIDYKNLLKENNLKVTPQRVAIMDGLDTYGHLTIDGLYKLLVDKFDSISLATIYKNLNAMVEKSFVEEVKIPNQKSVYEISKAAHSHLTCNNCGMVEDITIDLKTVIAKAKTSSDFQIDKTNLVFSGICSNCK